jgi:hypothetical protein
VLPLSPIEPCVYPQTTSRPMSIQQQQLPITKTGAAIGGAALFGGIGVCVTVATQWWVSSILAGETGRSFATVLSEHAISMLTLWFSVVAMFAVLGALLGAGTIHLRDRNKRPLPNAQPEG